MMRGAIISALVCALVVAAGCKGHYSSGEVSGKEKQACAEAIKQYMANVKGNAKDAAKTPDFLKSAESFRVVKVEKAGEILKALVEFSTEGRTQTRYMLVGKKGDTYVVTGVL